MGASEYMRSKRYPHLFRRGRIWWCYLPTETGRRPVESTGQTDEKLAHEWYLARVRGQIREISAEAQGKQRTLGEALEDRLQWIRSARKSNDPTRKKLSKDTVEFYEKKGLPLMSVLGKDTLLSEIDHETIRRYIVTRSETCRATSISKELTTLSMAMRLARKDGVVCENFKDLKPEDFSAEYIPRERWLPEDEADRILATMQPHHAGKVAWMIATGSTFPSEVLPVTRGMVNEKRFEVHIPGAKASTRDRDIVIPRYARKYFTYALERADGEGDRLWAPWVSVRHALHAAAVRASTCDACVASQLRRFPGTTCKACLKLPAIAPFSPNDLRRTFAQWLVRSGVPYELAYPMMGHGSERMLQLVYGKRDARSVAALVDLAIKRAPKDARRAG